MKIYKQSSNIKGGLFLLGIVLVATLLMYSQSIVNKLRDDNREIVQLYAEIIAASVSDESDANLTFVFDEIISKVSFPIIYADSDHIPIYSKNLPQELAENELKAYQKTMSLQNNPIPLEFKNPETREMINIGFLYFGDSDLIKRLQWLPYLEIGAVGLFIILGFVGFTMIRNNEKRYIWVGMARETAHQLGTPVSAMLGWLEMMRSDPAQVSKILDEISSDLDRLNQIVDRFSRMGTEAKMEYFDLTTTVHSIILYLEKRLPKLGKSVTIRSNMENDIQVFGNNILLSWALENLVKNAIDAIEHEQGIIELSCQKTSKNIIIEVTDNGKGIAKKNFRNIFRPGFSSKAQGWGMGLSLVKRIIEEIHSGRIDVKQSTEGLGTTFRITLGR